MPIDEMPHAVFHTVAVNEIALDQKQSETEPGQPSQDDPVGFRFGAFDRPLGRTKFYICKISFDVLRWIQGQIHRTEVFFVKVAIDEMMDGNKRPLPIMSLFSTWNTTGSSDKDEDELAIVSREGFIIKVPVTFLAGANVQAGPAPRVTRFYTDGGKFMVNWQDDKDNVRAVSYRVDNTKPEDQWEAIGERIFAP